MNAAIAQHLNIAESAIIRIEEWANVLFVVCKQIGARFVSKKVVMGSKAEKTDVEKLEEIGSRWTSFGKDRIYFEQSLIKQVLGLSNSKYRQLGSSKFFYDVADGKFYSQISSRVHGLEDWATAIRKHAGI